MTCFSACAEPLTLPTTGARGVRRHGRRDTSSRCSAPLPRRLDAPAAAALRISVRASCRSIARDREPLRLRGRCIRSAARTRPRRARELVALVTEAKARGETSCSRRLFSTSAAGTSAISMKQVVRRPLSWRSRRRLRSGCSKPSRPSLLRRSLAVRAALAWSMLVPSAKTRRPS